MVIRNRPPRAPVIAIFVLAAVVSACAGSPPPETTTTAGSAAPVPPQGRYKVGKPYQIKGVWYYPKVDYEYDEIGIASWYGPGFHGEMTANGEIYDMNELTAAHKTLPMPSIVRVTNLENGRTLKLRVNDRGPFIGDRIIDVSRRAAQLLGFYGAGTAKVRVQIEAEESQQLAAALTGVPATPIGTAALSAAAAVAVPAATEPTPIVIGEAATAMAGSGAGDGLAGNGGGGEVVAVEPQPLSPPVAARNGRERFVQAGAFADPDNAARARAKLDGLGPVQLKPLAVDGRSLLRVRVGPLASEDEAQRVLAAVLRAGFAGSRVVED